MNCVSSAPVGDHADIRATGRRELGHDRELAVGELVDLRGQHRLGIGRRALDEVDPHHVGPVRLAQHSQLAGAEAGQGLHLAEPAAVPPPQDRGLLESGDQQVVLRTFMGTVRPVRERAAAAGQQLLVGDVASCRPTRRAGWVRGGRRAPGTPRRRRRTRASCRPRSRGCVWNSTNRPSRHSKITEGRLSPSTCGRSRPWARPRKCREPSVQCRNCLAAKVVIDWKGRNSGAGPLVDRRGRRVAVRAGPGADARHGQERPVADGEELGVLAAGCRERRPQREVLALALEQQQVRVAVAAVHRRGTGQVDGELRDRDEREPVHA